MMNVPPYWIWKNELPESIIKVVEDENKTAKFEEASVGSSENSKIDHDIRKSSVYFRSSVNWLTGILHNYGIHGNNSAGWGLTLSLPETCQVTKYGLNEFYDYHTDDEEYSVLPYVRKVSVACCITDAADYEGGEFVFKHYDSLKLSRGDILVFPSSLQHKVNPVLSGERVSLITWIYGPNLR